MGEFPSAGSYVAHCDKDCLVLHGSEGDEYELHGDQTLSTVTLASNIAKGAENFGIFAQAPEDGILQSPRCLMTAHANIAKGAENFEISAQAPEPRLFIIHGSGGAEELLSTQAATAMLETATADPLAKIVGDQSLQESADVGDGRKCHTIFQKRLPDVSVAAPPALTALPDGLDVAGSIYSMATSTNQSQVSMQEPGMTITEFTQLIQYPEINE